MGRLAAGTNLAADRRTPVGQRRNHRLELNAASERVAAILSTAGAMQHFDPIDEGRIDEVEKRIDAAALRAIRVANAIDENVHFVAGQSTNEDAGHRRAGAL